MSEAENPRHTSAKALSRQSLIIIMSSSPESSPESESLETVGGGGAGVQTKTRTDDRAGFRACHTHVGPCGVTGRVSPAQPPIDKKTRIEVGVLRLAMMGWSPFVPAISRSTRNTGFVLLHADRATRGELFPALKAERVAIGGWRSHGRIDGARRPGVGSGGRASAASPSLIGTAEAS